MRLTNFYSNQPVKSTLNFGEMGPQTRKQDIHPQVQTDRQTDRQTAKHETDLEEVRMFDINTTSCCSQTQRPT